MHLANDFISRRIQSYYVFGNTSANASENPQNLLKSICSRCYIRQQPPVMLNMCSNTSNFAESQQNRYIEEHVSLHTSLSNINCDVTLLLILLMAFSNVCFAFIHVKNLITFDLDILLSISQFVVQYGFANSFLLPTVKKLELIQYGKDPDNSVR